jgi:hypothetical protein
LPRRETTAYVPDVLTRTSNIDMLAWFAEDERHDCLGCGERACVSLADAVATFCLACGRISIDGTAIELGPELAGVAPRVDAAP